MSKNQLVLVAITAVVVLMLAPRLRSLPVVSKIPTV